MRNFDYSKQLIADLVEQFKDKPRIEGLCLTIAKQLQDVCDFFEELDIERSVDTAFGAQLDLIGAAAGISRDEALELARESSFVYEDDDEAYRTYIKYMISRNSATGTYEDLMRSIRMQWNGDVSYSENPSAPATIKLTTTRFTGNDIAGLLDVPIVKAAGVKVETYTTASIDGNLYVGVSLIQRRSDSFTIGSEEEE